MKRALRVIASRDRIVAPCGKRMTAADSFEGHPTTTQNPVFLNRLNSVVGAGRLKSTAGGKEGGNEPLVKAYAADDDNFHYEFSRLPLPDIL